ncbi:MAG TPA: carboxylesterase/lipase family protein [Acidimicrobiales bacterium]|nr:carboxylesterase/lipase family protein [Acidimicrobiales bacterium]
MTRVETTSGTIEGTVEGGLHVFKGVPYARPPVGELRLRAPQPPEPWAGVRPAREFGLWAPQSTPVSALTGDPPGEQGEDCLTLNVWTPGTEGAKEVLVWVHGGAFLGGSGASVIYRGDRLASRGDVVVVTINYRLGILGFLAHPELADPDAGGAFGNWGLLDQVAALGWVRDNIAAFGGDPNNVTVFGESAGGMSVSDLLAVPAARNLFRRAIAQSGPPWAMSAEHAEETAAKLMAQLGVATPHAIRELPAPALLEAQESLWARRVGGMLPLTPVIDGAVLPVHPLTALREGASAEVPLLIGTNRDEFKFFIVADPKGRDPDEALVRRRIEQSSTGGERLSPDELIESYRAIRARRGAPVDPRELWSAIQSDRVFRIGSIRAAEAHAVRQPATFCYLFTWESPAMHGALGSCHALELPFVFGNLDLPGLDRFVGAGPDAQALSAQMMDAWLSFAKTGDPGWAPYDAERRSTMVFGPSSALQDAPMDEERALWDGA